MARTSSTTQARRVARARLAEKTANRRRREQGELEHLVAFEDALAHRAAAETEMATAVTALIDLGNSTAEAAGLTAQTESEIRRLRKLATATESIPAESVPAETGNGHHTHNPDSDSDSDSQDVPAAPPGPGAARSE